MDDDIESRDGLRSFAIGRGVDIWVTTPNGGGSHAPDEMVICFASLRLQARPDSILGFPGHSANTDLNWTRETRLTTHKVRIDISLASCKSCNPVTPHIIRAPRAPLAMQPCR